MPAATNRLVICLDNTGYEVSLERRKIYIALPDDDAESVGQLRIIDESGEGYLYPGERFVLADLPTTATPPARNLALTPVNASAETWL